MKKLKNLLVVALLISTFSISTKIVSASTEDGVVAKIDNTPYTSISEAINAAEENQTVVLDMNTTENITISKAITLDLGGYTLTGTGNGTVITINNVSTGNGVIVTNGTITGGNASNGGGILVKNSLTSTTPKEITLSNLKVTGNKAIYNAGGISITAGIVNIENCTISENSATYSSGGIRLDTSGYTFNSVVTVKNSTIENNTANNGGGISVGASFYETYKTEALMVVENSLIKNNTANTVGGALYLVGNGTRFTSTNTNITGNSATSMGGAIYSSNWRGITINGGAIANNTSNYGGGIYITNVNLPKNSLAEQKLNLTNSVIVANNTANIAGGGIYIDQYTTANITTDNVVLYNNTAKSFGADLVSAKGSMTTIGDATNEKLTVDCDNDTINGWYWDRGTRWNAHSENHENDYTYKMQTGTYTDSIYLKAAHNNGKVITHYVDINGNTLSEDVTSVGAVGSSYTTNLLDITDYALVKVEGNETGTITEEDTEVTYIYKYNVGTVIVNYVDKDGNNLSDSITINGTIGKEYTTEEKEFDSYVLVGIVGDSTGTITEGTSIVTYVYEWFDKNAKGGDVDDTVEVLPPQTGVEEITSISKDMISIITLVSILSLGLITRRLLTRED